MIPIPEDTLTQIIEHELKAIQSNIDIIDRIFPNATKVNRKRLKEFILKGGIRVVRGYPRDVAQVPCYVIMLGGEREQEEAIGSYFDEIGDIDFFKTMESLDEEVILHKDEDGGYFFQVKKKPIDEVYNIVVDDMVLDSRFFYVDEKEKKKGIVRILHDDFKELVGNNEIFVNYSFFDEGVEELGTRMHTQYRIETWTTNGDLTVMLYHLLQYIMIRNRDNIHLSNFVLQNLGGMDFEPLAEYFPEFVYRRVLSLEFTYEITYEDPYRFIKDIIVNGEGD